jgi:hypothetical protein
MLNSTDQGQIQCQEAQISSGRFGRNNFSNFEFGVW